MTLTDYQNAAMKTAVTPVGNPDAANLLYDAVAVTNEAGEFAGEVKKMVRDDAGVLTTERSVKMVSELGDTLWYIAKAARDLGYTLEEIATANLQKLEARYALNCKYPEGGKKQDAGYSPAPEFDYYSGRPFNEYVHGTRI